MSVEGELDDEVGGNGDDRVVVVVQLNGDSVPSGGGELDIESRGIEGTDGVPYGEDGRVKGMDGVDDAGGNGSDGSRGAA